MAVFARAFEQSYNVTDRYLSNMMEQKNMIVLAAYENKNIVGGLIGFEILPIHGNKEIYIYDIAVDPDYQKQGIGTKLIKCLNVEAQNRDVETIFVEAEGEDQDAI
jgi:aminoglycoside 3-N-acetyltransferase I